MDSNRKNFTKDDVQMAGEQECSASLGIREMQIKIVVHHY